MANLALLACLASTLFMTGVIWFVQVVHYPLFSRVGLAEFAAYHAAHTSRTSYVVFVPMVVELTSSAALVAWRPPGVGAMLAWAGLAAAGLTWLSTALVQVPLHGRLSAGFDRSDHGRLVRSNAARSLVWTAHSAIVLGMAAITRAQA